jgi:diguanylate cyclase (GGDEF)-like protein
VVAVTVVAGLAWFAWTATGESARADNATRHSTALVARYDQIAAALASVQAAETRDALRPSNAAQGALAKASVHLGPLIDGLSRMPGADRAVSKALTADQAHLERAVGEIHDAIQKLDAARVATIDARQLQPTIHGMHGRIAVGSAAASRAAAASVARSGTADDRLGLVALATAALALFAGTMLIRTLLLRNRLAVAHQREVEWHRTAARRDSLTGLRNHRSFLEDMQDAVARESLLSLVLIDLDGLKSVNDLQGHTAGDELLVKLANALLVATPEDAAAYRIGGDEFAVLVESTIAPESILASLTAACAETPAPQPVATAGYAKRAIGMSGGDLCHRADLALITAKRDAVRERAYSPELESPTDVAAAERGELASLLENPGGLTPVYQPIFDLRDSRVVSFEALTRFADTSRAPQEWFDLAQRHGKSVELETAALRAAIATPGRPAGTTLSLNISPDVLLRGPERLGLPDDLAGIIIEVTENALVTDGLDLERALHDLRARGARIAVDDAGAGYAGFGQLVRVRPDIIKLDRSLIHDVDSTPTKAAVLRAFIGYARDTGATICAEGIETEAELQTISALGATTGQGYLLGRPRPEWTAAALGYGAADPAPAGNVVPFPHRAA